MRSWRRFARVCCELAVAREVEVEVELEFVADAEAEGKAAEVA